MKFHIFCQVIDNYGDLGVCWRLSFDLALRNHDIYLWLDDCRALNWMRPAFDHANRSQQEIKALERIHILPWQKSEQTLNDLQGFSPENASYFLKEIKLNENNSNNSNNSNNLDNLNYLKIDFQTDVLIETFGCEIDSKIIANFLCTSKRITKNDDQNNFQENNQSFLWINLEYLSAENYVERSHGLISPVLSGVAKGCEKYFFYPGFTEKTGGLLRECNLLERQATFNVASWRDQWRASSVFDDQSTKWISLFCYEPIVLREWFEQLLEQTQNQIKNLKNNLDEDYLNDINQQNKINILITNGRAQNAFQSMIHEMNLSKKSNKNNLDNLDNQNKINFFEIYNNNNINNININCLLNIVYLPNLDQLEFDHLLWASDFNFVRGEDSLIRAIWAGKPFIWQIYPQEDNAHRAKLDAFLDWLDAPKSLRLFHHVWNGLSTQTLPRINWLDVQNDLLWSEWQTCASNAKARLLKQDDLTTQLLRFVTKKS